MYRYKMIVSVSLATLFLASNAFANHVDFISDAPFSLDVSGPSGSNSIAVMGAPGNILGGEREVLLFGDAMGTSRVSTTPSATDPNAVSAISASAGSDLVSALELRYDGIGNAGLGGLDFASSWISIAIEVSAVTSSWLAALEVTSGTANGALSATINAPGTYYFAFDALEYTLVDFGSVDAVSAVFTALGSGAEMTIESITRQNVVPEPGTALLLGAGLLGLSSVRRREPRSA